MGKKGTNFKSVGAITLSIERIDISELHRIFIDGPPTLDDIKFNLYGQLTHKCAARNRQMIQLFKFAFPSSNIGEIFKNMLSLTGINVPLCWEIDNQMCFGNDEDANNAVNNDDGKVYFFLLFI